MRAIVTQIVHSMSNFVPHLTTSHQKPFISGQLPVGVAIPYHKHALRFRKYRELQ